MIVLDVLGYFNRNKQNSYAALRVNWNPVRLLSGSAPEIGPSVYNMY